MNQYQEFLVKEARRRGIDYGVAARVAQSEGGLEEAARRGTFPTGSSWWAYQLHYGGSGYENLGDTAGMGNDFTSKTGWAPGDPRAWKDAMRFALDGAKAHGWGAWYGAAKNSITGFYGIDQDVPWSGTPPDEWDFSKGTGNPVTHARTEANLNLRAAPGTDQSVFTVIPMGDEVEFLDTDVVGRHWRHVKYGDYEGYVADDYLS